MKFKSIIIHSIDAELSCKFWAKVLDRNVGKEYPPYIELEGPDGPKIVIEQVDEWSDTGNGIHFDLKVENLPDAIDFIQNIGGTHVKTLKKDKWSWAIMRDPDGNVFCLCD